MALVIGAALPLSAAYLAGPFPAWARGVLLGAAAVGGAILLWWRGRLTGLRYGLALLAVAALAGWIWRGWGADARNRNPPGGERAPPARARQGGERSKTPAPRRHEAP